MTLCHYVGWEPSIYSKDRHAPAFCFLKYQAVAVCYYHLAILFSISPHSPFLINQDDQIEYCSRLRFQSVASCVSVYPEHQDRPRRNLPCCPKTNRYVGISRGFFFLSLVPLPLDTIFASIRGSGGRGSSGSGSSNSCCCCC